MQIVEYDSKYEEDVKDLLVELEEYIVSIDEDHLDIVGKDYREKMIWYDLKDVDENRGKCFIAVEDDKAIGVIMGKIRKYSKFDYLDYKCPKAGIITELVVTKSEKGSGIGSMLVNKMEEYFKEMGCKYVSVDVFAYNKNALNFYSKFGYHARMIDTIKKLD